MTYYPGTGGGDGVGLAVNQADFTDYTDATGAVFHDVHFYQSGSLVSQLYDLFPGTGTIGPVATAPPNALAGMIAFVPYSPGGAGQVNANFNVIGMGTLPNADQLPPPATADTGMGLTWSVVTSQDPTTLTNAGGIVAWTRIGQREIVEAQPGAFNSPLKAQDTPAPAPVLLRRYLRLQLQMTRSGIALGTVPPGGSSPEVFGLGIQPTITWMRLLDTQGTLYLVPSADGVCSIVSDTPQLTCATADAGRLPPPPSQLFSGGQAYLVDPPTVQLGAQGTFTFNISTAAVNAANLDPASLVLYSAAPGQQFTRVPNQSLDLVHGVVTGYITQIQLDTYFQVFGKKRPVAAKPEAPTATYVVSAATSALTVGWNPRENVFYASNRAI